MWLTIAMVGAVEAVVLFAFVRKRPVSGPA
jgi:hypothetical protein